MFYSIIVLFGEKRFDTHDKSAERFVACSLLFLYVLTTQIMNMEHCKLYKRVQACKIIVQVSLKVIYLCDFFAYMRRCQRILHDLFRA